MVYIYLKPGREKPVKQRQPWVFSGAVHSVEGEPQPGEVVGVRDAGGAFLAWGAYSPSSQIRVRLLDWHESTEVDEAWWKRRLIEAIDRRAPLLNGSDTDACRLVYAESDFLPGLIVDTYADYLVMQVLSAGSERLKEATAEVLNERLQPAGIYERSDSQVRKLEGLEPRTGPLVGAEPPERLEIREHGHRFLVDIRGGQKTGFYLDQRTNRQCAAEFARDRQVLDCFAYTGAFGVYAARAGAASVVSLDSSPGALELLKENFALNDLPLAETDVVQGNVFELLRTFRDRGQSFDMIVLDPPKLAPTRRSVGNARRAYKDLNLLAMKLLRPEGILATFSCSSFVSPELFQQIVTWASVDAEREVQILQRLGQAEDHPVRLAFPQSEYLKGFICRVH